MNHVNNLEQLITAIYQTNELFRQKVQKQVNTCRLYTCDAADDS